MNRKILDAKAAWIERAQAAESRVVELEARRAGPKIITLCGPTRFTSEMLKEAWRLTIAGVIVIHWNILESKEAFSHGAEAAGGNVKEIVDGLYLHKVAMADEVRVINVGGYIGESTRAELRHARKLGKPITWLEQGKVDKEFS